jgi:uncharacterized lipoprotein YddW (UPF0748 family)
MKIRRLLGIIVLALAGPGILQAQPHMDDMLKATPSRDREIIVHTAATPPKIDGLITDDCWTHSRPHPPLLLLQGKEPAVVQTSFQFAADREKLYFAARMEEPAIDKIKANINKHDDLVSKDDCIELLVDPFGTGIMIYRMVINSTGTVLDSHINALTGTTDLSWSPRATVAAKISSTNWSVETAIPLDSLGAGFSPRATINVGRIRRASGPTESSTYAPLETAGDFIQPEKFEPLTFEKRLQTIPAEFLLQDVKQLPEGKIGITFEMNQLPKNPSTALARIKQGHNKSLSEPILFSRVLQDGKGTLEVSSRLDGDCTLELTAYDPVNFTIFASSSWETNLPPAQMLGEPSTPKEIETRGVWFLYNRSAHPDETEGTELIAKAMKRLADNNFNQITVELKDTSGNAWWPSEYCTTRAFHGDWDPLQVTIDEAKKYNIKVYAWFDLFPEGKHANRLRGILKTDSSNAMIDRAGNPVGWLCPNHPRTWNYLSSYLREVVAGYEVDGMVLDYFRFPALKFAVPTTCFCEHCKQLFEKEYGLPLEQTGDFDARFVEFRQNSIDPLFEKAVLLIRGEKPKIPVMMYLGGHASVTYRAQNWPKWVHQGLLDIVCISGYQETTKDFLDACRRSRLITKSANPNARIYIAQGIHSSRQRLNSSEEVRERIERSREIGAEGQVLFYYQALEPFIDDVGKTSFAHPVKPEILFTHQPAEKK